MIEIFAGAAVLCSVAKQLGMKNSIAVDKVKKRNARSTIYQLDLLLERDRQLLDQWMLSGLLLWVHLAPVCGTASRARDIRRFDDDPKPLRSEAHPEVLPNLDPKDQERLCLANSLFEAACNFFLLACSRGVLATGKSKEFVFLVDQVGTTSTGYNYHLHWRFSSLHDGW